MDSSIPCHLAFPQRPAKHYHFSPSQALQFSSWLFQTLLPWLVFNCHLSLALHHASPGFLDLEITHPFWEQVICSLCLLLEHTTLATMESSLICISLEYLKLEVGTTLKIFNLPHDKWPSLASDCWLKLLWLLPRSSWPHSPQFFLLLRVAVTHASWTA